MGVDGVGPSLFFALGGLHKYVGRRRFGAHLGTNILVI